MEVVEQDRAYWCVTGHAIPADRLGELTSVSSLDRGARIRLCTEHGAPIAISSPFGLPPTNAAAPEGNEL